MAVVVGEIMKKTIVTADFYSTAMEAVKNMVKKDVGELVIIKNKKPVGIITEKDFVKKILVREMDPRKVRVSSIMTRPLITIPYDYDIAAASTLMAKKNIRRLLIVKQNEVLGIITSKEIVKHLKSYINALTRSVLFE